MCVCVCVCLRMRLPVHIKICAISNSNMCVRIYANIYGGVGKYDIISKCEVYIFFFK